MRGVLVLCMCLRLGVLGEEREERLVRSHQGPVKGYKEPGDSIFVFYGIPYATAPTGKQKFQAPLPAPAWFQTLEAVDKGIICPQGSISNFTFEGKNQQENCLLANVYVPDTEQKKLPVVVYVHGGAYQLGYGDLFSPRNLVRSKKVIVVTFNYRLGIHGFLCMGTNNAPGNAGIKDQIELLRWVKRHIGSYGGNPKDVTIAGFSAGSSAVDLLMISRAAKGLFNKVIAESGSNMASWSVQEDPLENAKRFAKSKGFKNVNDVYALEEFYTTASFEVLTSDDFWDKTDFEFGFSPCVERKTEDAVLTESPYNILKNGNYVKVPLLYGFSGMEGLLRMDKFELWKDKMNSNFSAFLPSDLKFENEGEKDAIANKIKQFYFGDKSINQESVLAYIDFMSDMYFSYSIIKTVNLHVKSGHDKIFLYEYNYVDESTPIVPFTKDVRGATHCAQTAAVFDGNFMANGEQTKDESSFTDEQKNMKKVMREIWLNFMTTGTPVPAESSLPSWPPTGAGGSPHMSLGSTLELRGALLEKRVHFWDEIYEKHYREPVPPPTPPIRHTEL